MNRHAPSFLVSVFVHLFFVALIFATYKYVVKIGDTKKEKRVCISLSCVKVEKTLESKIEKKKVLNQEKKVKKKETKKEIKKNSIKKKIVKEKEVFKTVPVKKNISKPASPPPPQTITEPITQEIKPQKNVVPKIKVFEKTNEEKYIDENLQKIVQILSENLYYPRSARKRGIEGVVKIRFVLEKDASTQNIEVLSSKSDILSRAAVKTIEDLSGELPKPNAKITLHVPIEYKLR